MPYIIAAMINAVVTSNFDPVTFYNSDMAARRIIYVDAGPQVGRRVRFVESSHHLRKNIVSGHDVRS